MHCWESFRSVKTLNSAVNFPVHKFDICKGLLVLQGFKVEQIETEQYLNLRYDGTDVAMMTKKASQEDTYENVMCSSQKSAFSILPETFIMGLPCPICSAQDMLT